jgi:hypothetical protein
VSYKNALYNTKHNDRMYVAVAITNDTLQFVYLFGHFRRSKVIFGNVKAGEAYCYVFRTASLIHTYVLYGYHFSQAAV